MLPYFVNCLRSGGDLASIIRRRLSTKSPEALLTITSQASNEHEENLESANKKISNANLPTKSSEILAVDMPNLSKIVSNYVTDPGCSGTTSAEVATTDHAPEPASIDNNNLHDDTDHIPEPLTDDSSYLTAKENQSDLQSSSFNHNASKLVDSIIEPSTIIVPENADVASDDTHKEIPGTANGTFTESAHEIEMWNPKNNCDLYHNPETSAQHNAPAATPSSKTTKKVIKKNLSQYKTVELVIDDDNSQIAEISPKSCNGGSADNSKRRPNNNGSQHEKVDSATCQIVVPDVIELDDSGEEFVAEVKAGIPTYF